MQLIKIESEIVVVGIEQSLFFLVALDTKFGEIAMHRMQSLFLQSYTACDA
jgi:hypothetical protein